MKTSLRIGLDARFVYDHFPGIGRYVSNLVRMIGTIDHPHTIFVLYNPDLPNTRHRLQDMPLAPCIQLIETSAKPFSSLEHVQIPHLARLLRLDVLHSPYYIKPYVGLPCPSIVTIYDLIGRKLPQLLSLRARFLFRITTLLAVHTAQHILTISASARDDIRSNYRVAENRVTVTPLAADARFQPVSEKAIRATREKYSLPDRYILYLGSNKPHKNIVRLVAAWGAIQHKIAQQSHPYAQDTFQHLDQVKLIIAGHYDSRYPESHQLVEALGLHQHVHFVPNAEEEDLPSLYSGAEVFVFPSYYEGFGLPPLEAMACGTPVLCANASSLPEVVGNAALTFDPYDEDELANSLWHLLVSPTLREHLRVQGLRQARLFSWERATRETLAVYEQVGRGDE